MTNEELLEQIAKMMENQTAAIDEKMDSLLVSVDEKLNRQTADIDDKMARHKMDIQIILEADVMKRLDILVDGYAHLNDRQVALERKLDNHEKRIEDLEIRVS